MTLTPRRLKHWMAGWLPEAVKAPLRGRLFGYRAAGVDLGLELRPLPDGVEACFAEGVSIRLPAAMVGDAAYHLRDNGASVEEMHGFVRHARARGGLLLDVGAYHGLFSAVFCALHPDHRAVAFEPSASLAGLTRDLLAYNGQEPRVRLRTAMVSDREGSARTWLDEQGFIRTGDAPAGHATSVTEIVTLDAECARAGLAPSMVKIDVEGDELRVLRGAAELLRAHRPVLFLELHLDVLESRGEEVGEIADLVAAAGYRWETPLGRPLSARAVTGSPAAVLRVVAR